MKQFAELAKAALFGRTYEEADALLREARD